MTRGKDEAFNPKRRPPSINTYFNNLFSDILYSPYTRTSTDEEQAPKDAEENDGVAGPMDIKNTSGFSDNETRD